MRVHPPPAVPRPGPRRVGRHPSTTCSPRLSFNPTYRVGAPRLLTRKGLPVSPLKNRYTATRTGRVITVYVHCIVGGPTSTVLTHGSGSRPGHVHQGLFPVASTSRSTPSDGTQRPLTRVSSSPLRDPTSCPQNFRDDLSFTTPLLRLVDPVDPGEGSSPLTPTLADSLRPRPSGHWNRDPQ